MLDFLKEVTMNNNRPWFMEHKSEYEAVKAEWERGVAQALERIGSFDPSVLSQQVKDCTYRFYRDTRFSEDKSPYKNHLGAYVNAHGKKALRGGYYIHMEPGHCLLAVGNYWLPTNILTSCRNELMANEEQGFGMAKLKTCPSGFPRDYEHLRYLRLKDYCAWHHVSDDFFEGDDWLNEMERIFLAAKPMMDFVNAVIDDYE